MCNLRVAIVRVEKVVGGQQAAQGADVVLNEFALPGDVVGIVGLRKGGVRADNVRTALHQIPGLVDHLSQDARGGLVAKVVVQQVIDRRRTLAGHSGQHQVIDLDRVCVVIGVALDIGARHQAAGAVGHEVDRLECPAAVF